MNMVTSFCTVAIHRAEDSAVRVDVTRIMADNHTDAIQLALHVLREVAGAPINDLRAHIVDVQPITDIEPKNVT